MYQPNDDGYRADEEAERRNHEARVRIAQRLLDETERARREENALNSAQPEPKKDGGCTCPNWDPDEDYMHATGCPLDQPKKPGFWSVLGNAIGEGVE